MNNNAFISASRQPTLVGNRCLNFAATALASAATAVAIALCSTLPCMGGYIVDDCAWNFRSNGDDRFHSNESFVRPWQSGQPQAPWPAPFEDGSGVWVGNFSYPIGWGSVDRISMSSGANGEIHVSADRDRQWRAWSYVYVRDKRDVTILGGGDCVPRVFVNGDFDSPYTFPATVQLLAGWNRLDVTGYNQNSGYTFNSGALLDQVDLMSCTATPEPSSFLLLLASMSSMLGIRFPRQ